MITAAGMVKEAKKNGTNPKSLALTQHINFYLLYIAQCHPENLEEALFKYKWAVEHVFNPNSPNFVPSLRNRAQIQLALEQSAGELGQVNKENSPTPEDIAYLNYIGSELVFNAWTDSKKLEELLSEKAVLFSPDFVLELGKMASLAKAA